MGYLKSILVFAFFSLCNFAALATVEVKKNEDPKLIAARGIKAEWINYKKFKLKKTKPEIVEVVIDKFPFGVLPELNNNLPGNNTLDNKVSTYKIERNESLKFKSEKTSKGRYKLIIRLDYSNYYEMDGTLENSKLKFEQDDLYLRNVVITSIKLKKGLKTLHRVDETSLEKENQNLMYTTMNYERLKAQEAHSPEILMNEFHINTLFYILAIERLSDILL